MLYYDEGVSMLERTTFKLLPIIKEVSSRMIGSKYQGKQKDFDTKMSMKVLLGYLNQSEWLYLLNIGNIM